MDKRHETNKSAALAANMRRLRGGRSIGQLRQEMADKGYDIGTGTLHRAIKGELGNRLESLQKIAAFFETTVDQLLQFEGVDETYWPFSAEMQQKVVTLSDEELSKLENVMRAHLDMPHIRSSDFATIGQMDTPANTARPYHRRSEDDLGLPENMQVPGSSRDVQSSTNRRRLHQKRGGGA